MLSSWRVAEKEGFLKFAPKYFEYMNKRPNVNLIIHSSCKKWLISDIHESQLVHVDAFRACKDFRFLHHKDQRSQKE